MTQANVMPFVQLREFGDDAKLLAGGRIWFYEAGSTTPKATWSDMAMSILNTNPVVLSASGSAKIFVSGAYSYKIERFEAGVYVEQSTGEFTTDVGGSVSLATFANYDALEASDGSAESAIVIDGFIPGDRAGGLFLRDNALTVTTTDGVSVVGTSGKWLRVYDGTIRADWCGVLAGGLSQGGNVLRALDASAEYGHPVIFDAPFQIEQAIDVPDGASVILADQCRISGALVVNWNFEAGSQLVSCAPGAFGPNVRPRFFTDIYQPLRLSWCKGATDDETLSQFLLMPSSDAYTIVVDKSLDDVRTDFAPPGKTSVRFEGGRLRFTEGSRSIAVNAWETPPARQIFAFVSSAVIGSITLPEPALPEWFGATGNGADDDTLPVRAAVTSHKVFLRSLYKVTGWNHGSWVEFTGDMIQGVSSGAAPASGIVVASGTLTFTDVFARECSFTSSSGATIMACDYLNAYECAFAGATAAAVTVANVARLTNCFLDKIADISGTAAFIGCRSLSELKTYSKATEFDVNGLYLTDIPHAELLRTAGNGQVRGIGSASTDTINIPAAAMNIKKIVTGFATIASGGTIPDNVNTVVVSMGSPLTECYAPSATANPGLAIRIIALDIGVNVWGDFGGGVIGAAWNIYGDSTATVGTIFSNGTHWLSLDGV